MSKYTTNLLLYSLSMKRYTLHKKTKHTICLVDTESITYSPVGYNSLETIYLYYHRGTNASYRFCASNPFKETGE